MMISFFSGCMLVTILYCIRLLIVILISKINKENFFKDFEFDFKQFTFELFLFGFIFLSFHLIFSKIKSIDYIQHIMVILVILLIPTYVYVILPIFYLLQKNNFKNIHLVNQVFVNKYEVKVIDKDLINAYATGIIPFSKKILIGSPLIDNLTEEELLSIQFHEAGHLEKKHIDKLFLVNILLSVLSYFLFVIRSIYLTFENELINFITVGVLGMFYGVLLWYIPGKIQYRFELEADKYSVENNGKENLINALKKLDTLSKGDVSKGGITHPKLSVRIKYINKL